MNYLFLLAFAEHPQRNPVTLGLFDRVVENAFNQATALGDELDRNTAQGFARIPNLIVRSLRSAGGGGRADVPSLPEPCAETSGESAPANESAPDCRR